MLACRNQRMLCAKLAHMPFLSSTACKHTGWLLPWVAHTSKHGLVLGQTIIHAGPDAQSLTLGHEMVYGGPDADRWDSVKGGKGREVGLRSSPVGAVEGFPSLVLGAHVYMVVYIDQHDGWAVGEREQLP